MSSDIQTEQDHPAWWKPWNLPWSVWGLMVLLMLALLPFVVRGVFLASVPEMAEPFDEAALVTDDIPPGENAFIDYRQAASIRKRLLAGLAARSKTEPTTYDDIYKHGWEAADEEMRAWLEEQREALAVWRRGTERSRATAVLPGELTFATHLEASQELRGFARMARVDQMRCLHEGDVAEAWQLARAIYRSGGHASERGPMISGLIGVAMHAVSGEAIARWAEHPSVTGDQLRAALAQFKADFTLYESESNMLKTEFLALRNSLQSREWMQFMGPGAGGGPVVSGDGILDSATRGWLWVVGEPELTVRVARQILANQIREIDKPLTERQKLVGSGTAMLFDLAPNATRLSGELDPAGIEHGLKLSIVCKLLLSATKQVDDSVQRFRAKQAALEVLLATQAYRRDKGEFPESLDQLVPQYWEAVPLDPCDRNGGRLLYRREELLKAIVWSVGEDGNDAGGAVESETGRAADVGFVLKAMP